MEFASADPSVIKSIRQRYLLNEWLRPAGKRPPMPLFGIFTSTASTKKRST